MCIMSLRDQIAETIESYIIDNRLLPGSRLPSEREMCEVWGFNRISLRSALRRLSDFGIIDRKVGYGTFVAKPRLVRNLQDTIGFTQAVRESGHIPSNHVVDSQIIEANKFLVRNLHVMLGSPVFAIRRIHLIDGVPVSLEISWINTLYCKKINEHNFSQVSLYEVLKNIYGIIPTKGSEKINVTLIDDEEAGLLGVKVGASAFLQKGLILDQYGRPIEFFKSITLSDHVSLATELRYSSLNEV